jgi:hypothetical protein
MKYKEMVDSIGSKSEVSQLVDWGKKNKVFVSKFVDLGNEEEVSKCIKKLKSDNLWEK